MLLNLTNHPSSRWPENQVNMAINLYEEIHDWSFPNIDPTLSSTELDELVHVYLERIGSLQPTVVHIMGEMTFSFRLIRQLQRVGIPCVASTTARITEQQGDTKISRFEFIQFRSY